MNFNKVTDNFCVSEQITVSDLQTIKEAGFKSIICNRPENESSDQTSYHEIQKHCELLGLSFFNLPRSIWFSLILTAIPPIPPVR